MSFMLHSDWNHGYRLCITGNAECKDLIFVNSSKSNIYVDREKKHEKLNIYLFNILFSPERRGSGVKSSWPKRNPAFLKTSFEHQCV